MVSYRGSSNLGFLPSFAAQFHPQVQLVVTCRYNNILYHTDLMPTIDTQPHTTHQQPHVVIECTKTIMFCHGIYGIIFCFPSPSQGPPRFNHRAPTARQPSLPQQSQNNQILLIFFARATKIFCTKTPNITCVPSSFPSCLSAKQTTEMVQFLQIHTSVFLSRPKSG